MKPCLHVQGHSFFINLGDIFWLQRSCKSQRAMKGNKEWQEKQVASVTLSIKEEINRIPFAFASSPG